MGLDKAPTRTKGLGWGLKGLFRASSRTMGMARGRTRDHTRGPTTKGPTTKELCKNRAEGQALGQLVGRARAQDMEGGDMAGGKGWIGEVRKTQDMITGNKAEGDRGEPAKDNGIGVLVIGRGSTGSGTRGRIQWCQDTP